MSVAALRVLFFALMAAAYGGLLIRDRRHSRLLVGLDVVGIVGNLAAAIFYASEVFG